MSSIQPRYSNQTSNNNNSNDDDDNESTSFISWLMFRYGFENCIICNINPEYIEEKFNLNGLDENKKIEFFNQAITLIIDNYLQVDNPMIASRIEEEAEFLYMEIHKRYILTSEGIKMMRQIYNTKFPMCPKYMCNTITIPHDFIINSYPNIFFFCPKCGAYYFLEGYDHFSGYFGSNFSHYFLLMNYDIPRTHKQVIPPRIYGYKINKNSPYYLESNSAYKKEEKKLKKMRNNNIIDSSSDSDSDSDSDSNLDEEKKEEKKQEKIKKIQKKIEYYESKLNNLKIDLKDSKDNVKSINIEEMSLEEPN